MLQGPEPLRQLSRTSRALQNILETSAPDELFQFWHHITLTVNNLQSIIKFGLVERHPNSSFFVCLHTNWQRYEELRWVPCVTAGATKHLDFNHGLCGVLHSFNCAKNWDYQDKCGVCCQTVKVSWGKQIKQLLQPLIVQVDPWPGSTWWGTQFWGSGREGRGKGLVKISDIYLLAALRSLWDLSSPTRDWTWALSSESAVITTGPPGNSLKWYLLNT